MTVNRVEVSREQLEKEAATRNEMNQGSLGPRQHWYVVRDGHGYFMTARWENVPLKDRIRERIATWLGITERHVR